MKKKDKTVLYVGIAAAGVAAWYYFIYAPSQVVATSTVQPATSTANQTAATTALEAAQTTNATALPATATPTAAEEAQTINFRIPGVSGNSSTGQMVLTFEVTNDTTEAITVSSIAGAVFFDTPPITGNPYTKSTPSGFPADGNEPGFAGNATSSTATTIPAGQTGTFQMSVMAGQGPNGTGTAPNNAEAYVLANFTLVQRNGPHDLYEIQYAGHIVINGTSEPFSVIYSV